MSRITCYVETTCTGVDGKKVTTGYFRHADGSRSPEIEVVPIALVDERGLATGAEAAIRFAARFGAVGLLVAGLTSLALAREPDNPCPTCCEQLARHRDRVAALKDHVASGEIETAIKAGLPGDPVAEAHCHALMKRLSAERLVPPAKLKEEK